jgi:hypothetical protein
MSYSISTLLTRDLHEVFGKNRSSAFGAAIDEIHTEDCLFYDLRRGVHRARLEIGLNRQSSSASRGPTRAAST